MKKLLDNNDMLMYSTYNKGTSVVAERFTRTLKSKTYKKMATCDSHSYLDYLDKLVDEYNNTYHHSIGKKPVNYGYYVLTW